MGCPEDRDSGESAVLPVQGFGGTRTAAARLAVAVLFAAGTVAGTAAPAEAVSRGTIVSAAWGEYGDVSRNAEYPPGSNCNFYTGVLRRWNPSARCPATGGVRWRASPWCADFARYVWGGSGVYHVDVPAYRGAALTGLASSFRDYGLAYGTWYPRSGGYTPQPGDAISFDWNGNGRIDHVGLVTSATSDTVYTVEGNRGNRVSARTYSRHNTTIAGYTAPVRTSYDPGYGGPEGYPPYSPYTRCLGFRRRDGNPMWKFGGTKA
ncbi:CHAP domain-containing protein [Rhizohabitans arisaemae]|uniref:CHAP domain-containing protein n=1 Tax=Rhizohabitans arisaemae TaxID=2720610 RepID=UPI0024B0EF78|nr:CHAP domain-containing protein [Rhizohabitans arisaemae]